MAQRALTEYLADIPKFSVSEFITADLSPLSLLDRLLIQTRAAMFYWRAFDVFVTVNGN